MPAASVDPRRPSFRSRVSTCFHRPLHMALLVKLSSSREVLAGCKGIYDMEGSSRALYHNNTILDTITYLNLIILSKCKRPCCLVLPLAGVQCHMLIAVQWHVSPSEVDIYCLHCIENIILYNANCYTATDYFSGLTNSNYTELAQLYEKYKDQGFEILAFPCNQFGGQEPGTNEEIVQLACTRFKAEYPIFDKVDVNGNREEAS